MFDFDRPLHFRSDVTIAVVGQEQIFALDRQGAHFFTLPDAAETMALVDGYHSFTDIILQQASKAFDHQYLEVFSKLTRLNKVVFSDVEPYHGVQFGRRICRPPTLIDRDISIAIEDLSVRGVLSELCDALSLRGIRGIDAEVASASVVMHLVVVDDFRDPRLDAFNRAFLAAGDPKHRWILLSLESGALLEPFLGPVIRSQIGPRDDARVEQENHTPCWECVAFRLRANSPVAEYLNQHDLARVIHQGAAPLPTQIFWQGVAGMLCESFGYTRTSHEYPLQVIDSIGRTSRSHLVVRRPQCPACGDAEWMRRQAGRPIILSSRQGEFCEDGGSRVVSPEETIARHIHLVSKMSGAVNHLDRVDEKSDELRRVYSSGYFVVPGRTEPINSFSFHRQCAGKGVSEAQSRASALCEALERQSGIFQGDEFRIRASRRELNGYAYGPDELQNFSEAQFRLDKVGHDAALRHKIPIPYAPDTELEWTSAWSLLRKELVWIPLAYVYSSTPEASGAAYCVTNPNGVAAGNCLEEAILQGFFELVERDAVAIWWTNQIVAPTFDFTDFCDAFVESLLCRYDDLGWEIRLLDLTHDFEIPLCAALAFHRKEHRYAIGFGAHLDPKLALRRALCEVNQLVETRDSGRKAPWDDAALRSRAFLQPSSERRKHQKYGGDESVDLQSMLQVCMNRVQKLGLDFLVVDKTRPDIGLSVAQVIVPGLRHFWPRLGPGRLYEVPLKMGWRSRIALEDELNPVALFL